MCIFFSLGALIQLTPRDASPPSFLFPGPSSPSHGIRHLPLFSCRTTFNDTEVSVVWAPLTNQSGEVLFVVYDAKRHSHLSQYKFFLTLCLAHIFFQLCKIFKVPSSWTSFWFYIVNVISWRWLVNLRGNFSFPRCTSFYMPRNTLLFNLKMQHALSWDFSLSAVWIQWNMGRVMFPALYHSLWSLTWWWKMHWLSVVYISIFPSAIASGVKKRFRLFRCGLGTCCTQWFWLSLWGHRFISIEDSLLLR